MKIIDAWTQSKDVFAYCVGDGINANFSCKEISVDGKTYAVDGFDILTSLNGSVAAILKIGGNIGKDLPHGPFRIVS